MPRVTIVTPTYNPGRYIRDCVESVLAQTFTDWEMIVADDGSTDGTPDVVRSYADPRVNVISLPHRGLRALAHVYNAALQAGTGELVAVLEGDDFWPADKLAVQVSGFEDPATQLSWGAGHEVGPDGQVLVLRLARGATLDGGVRPIPNRELFHALSRRDAVMPSISVMVRRAALDRIGGFRQDGGPQYVDLPTWLNVLAHNRGLALYHHHVLGCWRRHPNQTTHRHLERILRERWRVVQAVAASLDAEKRAQLAWTEDDDRLVRSRRRLACARSLLRRRRFAQARRLHTAVLGAGPGVPVRSKALKGLVSDVIRFDLSGAWRRLRGRA